MKPTSERMLKVATERRIRTPAIWTILKDYAGEVKELEDKHADVLLENARLRARFIGTLMLDIGMSADEAIKFATIITQKEKA